MKAASPKLLLQIMQRHTTQGIGSAFGEVWFGNLNSEHIKSHLQKFRQYSERSQGEFLTLLSQLQQELAALAQRGGSRLLDGLVALMLPPGLLRDEAQPGAGGGASPPSSSSSFSFSSAIAKSGSVSGDVLLERLGRSESSAVQLLATQQRALCASMLQLEQRYSMQMSEMERQQLLLCTQIDDVTEAHCYSSVAAESASFSGAVLDMGLRQSRIISQGNTVQLLAVQQRGLCVRMQQLQQEYSMQMSELGRQQLLLCAQIEEVTEAHFGSSGGDNGGAEDSWRPLSS